ncbi:MAG TPA: helix-turn-helix transcriptional regulator [Chthoniobacteraceae bacterium]|nr:helix-turn-helix transcriptional regulator [Chthoniobacteraceae bacterium]
MDWQAIKVVPKANSSGFITWTETHRIKQEWFEEKIKNFDFWLVSGGFGEVRLKDGRVFEMKRGSLYHLYPDLVEEAWQQPDRERVSMFWFHHELWKSGKKMTVAELGDMPIYHQTADIGFYEMMAHKLLALLNFSLTFTLEEFEKRRAEAAILLQGLLMDFEHHAGLDGAYSREILPAQHLMVRRLALKVAESPERFRSAEDLARAAGYHKVHLARLFREALNETPTEVIINARVRKAKKLLSLARVPLSMAEIAEMCGYQNVFYFSNQFKQRTGYSPSEFKQVNEASGNIPCNWGR